MNAPSSFPPKSGQINSPVRPRRWYKILPWTGGVGLLLLIVAGLWPSAQPVEIATMSRGPMVVTVDEEGMTRVKNRYVVASPVGGLLRRIEWKPGAPVEAGK
ncbi:MAG: RND transporter, partial [Cephaloticoccus sp.]|nr:RND transporter [Cephaloticoccus sp.]